MARSMTSKARSSLFEIVSVKGRVSEMKLPNNGIVSDITLIYKKEVSYEIGIHENGKQVDNIVGMCKTNQNVGVEGFKAYSSAKIEVNAIVSRGSVTVKTDEDINVLLQFVHTRLIRDKVANG